MKNTFLLTTIVSLALFVLQNPAFGQKNSEKATTSGTSESRLQLESKDLKTDSPVMKDITLRIMQPRLPNYYTSVVTQKQRDDIRAIQNQYLPLIEMLSARLDALRTEMNKKVRDVLSEEQQSKVDQLAEDAKNRRRTKQ
ncbi:MAG: hypothetical protein FWC43_05110 [Planctomycetaceae bacterium]|nr:hypothetical protein [Planctomycetaceae bacterium]